MDKVLTRTRHSTRLNKRDNQLDVDYNMKHQNIDQNFSDTYSVGLDDSNNYYTMSKQKNSYYGNHVNNPSNNGRNANKRTAKTNRRVNNNTHTNYNEDEQFKSIVEIFGNFIVDLNKMAKRQGNKKNKKANSK